MKNIKSIYASFCIAFIIFSCVACNSYTAPKEAAVEPLKGTLVSSGDDLMLENQKVSFALSLSTGNITVTEKQTGRIWKSNPEKGYEDPYAAGISKTNLFSQLVVAYKTETKGMQTTNSYASCVSRKSVAFFSEDSALRVEYTFREGFVIPVRYTLTDSGFAMEILYDRITEDDGVQISTIELLPYFGLADEQCNGYFLIPDGSGALINFNNGKTDAESVNIPVYGRDLALPYDIETTRNESVRLPMFGMKRDDGACIVSVKEGVGEAYITASVSGKSTAFNTASFKAVYRAMENLSVLNGSLGTAGLVLYSAQSPTDLSAFCVEYEFLDGYNLDYNSIAAVYREKLIKEGLLKKSDDEAALYVDLYGGVLKEKSFAGFPYTGIEPLTTYEQAIKVLESLSEKGANRLVAGYRCGSKSYFEQTLETDLSPVKALGGKKEFKHLIEYASKNDISLFFHSDFYSFLKSGNGGSKFSASIKTLDLAAAKIYPKKINTNIPDTSAKPLYLLASENFDKATQIIKDSARKNKIDGIYIGDIGSSIAGNYAVGGQKRTSAISNLTEAVSGIDNNIMISAPNLYLWQYAKQITNLPMTSSRYSVYDCEVPFLQMLLKGSVPYSGAEMNLSNVSDDAFLLSISYASNIHYALMHEKASALQNTDLYNYYGLSDVKIEQATVQFKEFERYYDLIKGSFIQGWYKNSDVLQTDFSNGISVFTNLSYSPVSTSFGELAARSYTLLRDGAVILTGGEKS